MASTDEGDGRAPARLDPGHGADAASPDVVMSAGDDVRPWGESARAIGAAAMLLAFAGFTTWTAIGFGSEARRLPLVVGFPLVIMGVINLVFVVREERRRLQAAPGSDREAASETSVSPNGDAGADALRGDPSQEEPHVGASGTELSFAAALGALAVVTGLFFLIGFIPTTVVFTLGFMRGVGRESWRKSIGMTTGLVLFFWLFRALLDVRFYKGWLASEDIIPYLLPF